MATCCAWVGTGLALRKFRRPIRVAKTVAPAASPPGISVIKPVKGLDPHLEQCLSSFFELTYPRFELLFCVADGTDPAIDVIKALIARHPRVRARLSVGAANVGFNPKVNNMARSYAEARYDCILISDSNMRIERDGLEAMAADFDEGTGVLTAIVAGVEAWSWAGRLEALFLNAYYARWMLLAERCGLPCVIGKSMMFRRSEADRFGGLTSLGRYLAEDYMAGKAMAMLGLRVRTASRYGIQPIGALSFKTFWARHLRWGRIRRSQAPLAHAAEMLVAALPSGACAAFAAQSLFGVGWFVAFAAHLTFMIACDVRQIRALGQRFGWRDLVVWFARELLAVPLWLHAVSGHTVDWRGQRIALGPGGLIDGRA